ncbi:MAG: Uma2 family endonuclease [Aquificales bacterium]|nr:Uma2 family endonuclease [Aquificales bacterium]
MTITAQTPNVFHSRPYGKTAVPHPLPLENGARLSRAEFERRYAAMPHVKKTELIEGVVYMPSPVHFQSHSEPHADIIGWLTIFRAATPGVRLGDNATVRLDIDNEVQPDTLLRLNPELGGASRISSDDYIEGSPELIVEISASSASYDLYEKKNVYRRNGVQEYLVWRVYDEALDWFQLREGEYHQIQPDENGMIRSQVFPGLHLDVTALLTGDLPAVLAAVKAGTETDEHIAFGQRLENLAQIGTTLPDVNAGGGSG